MFFDRVTELEVAWEETFKEGTKPKSKHNPDPAKSNSKRKRQLMAITKATKHKTYKLSELELSP